MTDGIEASAEELYLLLWKRLSIDEAAIRVSGDEQRVLAFLGSRLVA